MISFFLFAIFSSYGYVAEVPVLTFDHCTVFTTFNFHLEANALLSL